MSTSALIFLFGFAVLAVFSIVPAVRKEISERRHLKRVQQRYDRLLEQATRSQGS